jgi:hypothetical protein
MLRRKRFLSSLLMTAGIGLVFYGLNSALGFTVPGMLASVAAIASLLYAGGALFGEVTHAARSEAVHPQDAPERAEARAADVQPS